jgi:hypothetical protein
MQFDNWVGQDGTYTREGWSDSANDHFLGRVAVMMNPTTDTLSPVCTSRRVEMFWSCDSP